MKRHYLHSTAVVCRSRSVRFPTIADMTGRANIRPMMLAGIFAVFVAVTALLSLTWGKGLTRRNRTIAVLCCASAVPLLLLFGAVADWIIAITKPPPTAMTDQWPLGMILLIFALLSLPLTLVTSALLVPHIQEKDRYS
jgi:hypothetical protein